MKGPVVQTKDGTISIDRSKFGLSSLGSPVSVDERSDKAGTSLSMRPEGGFGFLVRVDRLAIGHHPMAPQAKVVGELYLKIALEQLRGITYSQKGIKRLGTASEAVIVIDGVTALVAIDQMSVEVPQASIPKLYRGFLLFAANGNLVIVHYEGGEESRETTPPMDTYLNSNRSFVR